MHIYLFRHGDAPFDSSCGERSLSDQGEIETRKVVEQQLESLSKLDLIVCSPALRARQTLQVLTETLNYSGQLLFEDALRSESSVRNLESCIDALLESQSVDHILLLGHQPLIGQILEYLTDETGLAWSMGTSALATLDTSAFGPSVFGSSIFGQGCAELKSLTQPG